MAKTDRCVVRNEAYRRGGFSIRERHNERKNESYFNGDIIPERAGLNEYFKTCNGTYEQQFNRMVEAGEISLRGLKADAKIFDELVFDVNSAYFENHGGYDYAKEFFAEAYRLAVKEVGGEEYILSAVLHADERNKALSEQLGRDVFHYHLHVIYVPVVNKEIYYNKNNKNPELAGKLREVIKQVSHSKKWPQKIGRLDEQGNPVLSKIGKALTVNSYSLLQDRFHEHMKAAGFTDFERGERGSNAEHLSVLDYKIQQDEARVATMENSIEEKTSAIAALDGQAKEKQAQLEKLDKKLEISKQKASTLSEIESMGKKTRDGNVQLTLPNWKKVFELVKEALLSRGIIKSLKASIDRLKKENTELKDHLAATEKRPSVIGHLQYLKAQERAPRRLDEVVADILCHPSEQQKPKKAAVKQKEEDYAQ